MATGVTADLWPVAAEILSGKIDPQILALIGGVTIQFIQGT